MTKPIAFVLAVLLCVFGIVAGDSPDTPVFSPHYHVKGTLYIPSAEVIEPFESWYDSHNNRSRVDYYDGAVKTFQFLPVDQQNGISYKIVPSPAYGPTNEQICWKSDGSNSSPTKLQGMLPDLKGFTFMGGDLIRDVSTQRWEKITPRVGSNLVSRYTMWVRPETDGQTRETYTVPIRYDIKGINTLLDAHFDHYYFEYTDYSPSEIDAKEFDIKIDSTKCNDVDANDIVKKISMNPMREFVEGEDGHILKAFQRFKREFGKNYGTTQEHTMRLDMFRMNYRYIQSLNRANRTFRVDVNHFADRGPAELKAMRGHFPMNTSALFMDDGISQPMDIKEGNGLPKNFNWILKGAVTPVKDQATCGSCYAFSTTGAIEGAYFIKCKRLIRLSEQSLVDCTWDQNNRGCSGGKVDDDYRWIMDKGGIPLDGEYGPYLNEDGSCHTEDIPSSERVRIKGYRYIKVKRPVQDKPLIDLIKTRLMEKGPLSVLIATKSHAFTFYSGGLYDDCLCAGMPQSCARKMDHSALLVGFGELEGRAYWLVKNSWSEKWGLNGYILMHQEVARDCGINYFPSYVEIAQCLDF